MNNIPIIGWFIDLACKVSLSVPFWIVWTQFGIGEKYFSFMGEVYMRPGYWETVGVFIVLGILRGFSPVVLESSSSADKEEKS